MASEPGIQVNINGNNMQCEDCKKPIKKTRTSQQNRALHLYYRLLADALNDSGYDMRATIRQEIDIPWTPTTIKEHLWRPIQQRYLRERSTTKLETKDIDKVYDILNKVLAERTGVHVPFPCIDNIIHES